jgi:hypothetical protein
MDWVPENQSHMKKGLNLNVLVGPFDSCFNFLKSMYITSNIYIFFTKEETDANSSSGQPLAKKHT